MVTVALIPLRGGSKSIPLKNIKPLLGRPLAHWVIEAALQCPGIDEVFVCTDSAEIRACVSQIRHPKLKVIDRSPETATDTASTESVLLEFAVRYQFDNVVLIQATSPLLESEDLAGGLDAFQKGDYDSLLSVVRQKRFIWREANSSVEPLNYDPKSRPRRQEFDGFLVENGAFYISRRANLLATGSRLSGRIGSYEMSDLTYFEIDEPDDWSVVEGLLKTRRKPLRKQLDRIRLVATDVDGVLTDAGMYYADDGDELKKFNTRDGKGFELLRNAGFRTAIITSETTKIVSRRAEKLKVDHVCQGALDKPVVLQSLLAELDLKPDQVLYIGDDINDLEVLKSVGFSACPADAIDSVRTSVDHVCRAPGGGGCFREIAELLLETRGTQSEI